MRIQRADSISRGWRGLFREKEKADPVRPLPGPSGIWRTDSSKRIPARCEEISQKRKGYVSVHAEGLFRSADCNIDERLSRCCSVRSERRTNRRLSLTSRRATPEDM